MTCSCPHCGQSIPTGQKPLTEREKARVPTTNQYGDHGLTIIQWQAVKGAAAYYGVEDWISHADPTLTCDENKALMAESGYRGQSMKELAAKEKEAVRERL